MPSLPYTHTHFGNVLNKALTQYFFTEGIVYMVHECHITTEVFRVTNHLLVLKQRRHPSKNCTKFDTEVHMDTDDPNWLAALQINKYYIIVHTLRHRNSWQQKSCRLTQRYLRDNL